MPPARKREPVVPARVKTAIGYMLEQRADMPAAAAFAGISTYELRRSLGRPNVLRYAREQKKAALEVLCLASPANLAEVLRGSNEMAKVNAVKAAEALRLDAVELEQRAVQRAPGLQIVIIQNDGSRQVAYQPPTQTVPMIEVTPALPPPPEPAIRPDADVE